MIGHLVFHIGVAATLAVSPFFPRQPEATTLNKLLDDGYELKSSISADGQVLLLQKGTVLYGCEVSARVLAETFANGGGFPGDQIQCEPFIGDQ